MEKIKRFFRMDDRKTSFKTEILAGITTFLTMMYILPVNAGMLAQTGMPYGGLFLATALAAIVATLVMGLLANYPVALAPGMGVNAFFTYTVVFTMGHSWQFALAATLVSGVIFLAISATGLRRMIIDAIPLGLKYAVGAGIGFFIAFIGLQNSGIIVGNGATLVSLGNLADPAVLLTLFGLVVTLILYVRGNKFALIIGLVATAVVGVIVGGIFPEFQEKFVDGSLINGLPVFGDMSLKSIGETLKELGTIKDIFGKAFGSIGAVFTSATGWVAIFTFLFIDFFDTAGTLSAVGVTAGLMDEKTGELIDGEKALLADSIGTVVGAILGTSTTTSFVESEAGIEQGGRTGLTAVTVAVLFGFAIIFYPFFQVFNAPVTAVALIMVGSLMVGQLRHIDWESKETTIASFFTILFMVLSYSIAEGIAFGFVIYSVLMLFSEKRKQVHPIMYGLSVFFLVYYVIHTMANNGVFK